MKNKDGSITYTTSRREVEMRVAAAERLERLEALRIKYWNPVEQVIARAKAMQARVTVAAEDGAEAYAYPLRRDRIAWGVKSAETSFNIWRGVRRPDGRDEAET